MAEPLIAQYGPDVPQAIARMVAAVHPRFDMDAFLHDALNGYEALALMPRGKHIARALHRHLPPDYGEALRILLASADQPHGRAPGLSLASVIVFASSTSRELAQEEPAWGNGAFTKALIEGIKGGADKDKTGLIRPSYLSAYVSDRVRALTKGTQRPTMLTVDVDDPIASKTQ